MKAIILAAGYATRLYPLTLNMPKALLPIGGRPIIDHIVDELNTIPELTGIYVVTNHKFAAHFEDWAREKPITVLDDGTDTEETRLGAIGDIQFVLERAKIEEDVIIIAGDNYFTYRLADYAAFYREVQKDCVCVTEIRDLDLLRQFGVALIDESNILIDVEEKPAQPKSFTAIFATYIYRKETLPLFARYLAEGNKPDAPGYFVQWLYKQKEVAAYHFQGRCYDIGTPASYEEVQALFP